MSTDKETLAVYNARAEDYARCLKKEDSASPVLEAFVAALPAGGRVLDLGCGPGTWARMMLDAGLEVEAIDASEAMVAEAAQIPGLRVWQATFGDVDGLGRYDGIWANFSLLHAPRMEMPSHLARLHRALRPGGRLHIGLKEETGARRDGIGRFYTYHTAEGLTALLGALGFSVQDLQRGASEGLDGVVAPWFTLTAIKD